MNKIKIYTIILILIFGIGFFIGRYSNNSYIIREAKIDDELKNIVNYTNYIHSIKYITNDITEANCSFKYEELKMMYNDLLKRNKDVALSYTAMYKRYEQLESKANQKLYFLVGTDLVYNINKNIVDIGLSCGTEYNNFGFMLGYMFLDRQVNLNVYYRF